MARRMGGSQSANEEDAADSDSMTEVPPGGEYSVAFTAGPVVFDGESEDHTCERSVNCEFGAEPPPSIVSSRVLSSP